MILINFFHLKFSLINWLRITRLLKLLSKLCISGAAVSRIFVLKIFCKSLSKYLWCSLFLVNFYPASRLFLTALDACAWSMEIILWEASYFKHSNNIQVAVWNCKSLIANTFDASTLKMKKASPIQVIKNKKCYFEWFFRQTRTLFLRDCFFSKWIERRTRTAR